MVLDPIFPGVSLACFVRLCSVGKLLAQSAASVREKVQSQGAGRTTQQKQLAHLCLLLLSTGRSMKLAVAADWQAHAWAGCQAGKQQLAAQQD